MYNILVFSVTAGNGHNNLANAFSMQAKRFYGDEVNIKIVRLFNDYHCPIRNFFLDDYYRMSVKYALPLYNKVFITNQEKRRDNRDTFWLDISLIGMYKKMLKTIEEFKPDCIFCSHFLPCIALSRLEEKGQLNIPYVTLLTDYVVTPYIECAKKVDLVFVPNEELKQEMIQIGFKEEQLLVTGLLSKADVDDAPRPKGKRLTILAMSGAGAFSGLFEQIKHLLKANLDIDVILINGKDAKKKKQFDKYIKQLKDKGVLTKTNVENYGFVSDEELLVLFKRADCIVSKTGGNSVSEIVNLNKVLIASKKLAQQEWLNVEYLQRFAECFLIDKKDDLVNLIKSGVFTDEFFAKYMQDIKQIQTPNASKQYVDTVINLCKQHRQSMINETK